MAFSCILVFLFSGSYLMVQGTQITLAREKIQPDDDILLLQNSNECRKNGDKFFPKCNKFSAAPLDAGCWCQCHSETSTGKNTFFEPNNTCVPVAFARQTSGRGNNTGCFKSLCYFFFSTTTHLTYFRFLKAWLFVTWFKFLVSLSGILKTGSTVITVPAIKCVVFTQKKEHDFMTHAVWLANPSLSC